MTKHTPFPFTREPMVGRGAWIKGSNGNWFALSCGDTDEEALANAILIEAIPQLIQELQRQRADLITLKQMKLGNRFDYAADAMVQRIDAAMAMAEGGAE